MMDYRDRAAGGDGIVSHAPNELAYADKLAKQVLIGVETLPNALKKVSFHHLKEADMERELGLTAKSAGAMPPFGGFAVHHDTSYRKWLGLDQGRAVAGWAGTLPSQRRLRAHKRFSRPPRATRP